MYNLINFLKETLGHIFCYVCTCNFDSDFNGTPTNVKRRNDKRRNNKRQNSKDQESRTKTNEATNVRSDKYQMRQTSEQFDPITTNVRSDKHWKISVQK